MRNHYSLNPGDNGYEPREIHAQWTQNRGYMHLEAKSKSPLFNPSQCIITEQAGFSKFQTYNVRKIAVTKFSYADLIPTVNSRNQTLTFTVNGVQYTGVMDIGFYRVPSYGANSFLDHLITTMSNASGFTFQIDPVVVNKFQSVYGGGLFYNIYITDSPLDTWKFIKTSAMEKLVPVFGPNFDTTETNSKVVGPNLLVSTRYFDVRSSKLTQDQKLQSYSNSYGSADVIHRVYLQNIYDDQTRLAFGPPPDGPWSGANIVSEVQHLKWINCDPSRQLTGIDITLIDEFGEILETIPPLSQENGYPFSYSIELIMEPNM